MNQALPKTPRSKPGPSPAFCSLGIKFKISSMLFLRTIMESCAKFRTQLGPARNIFKIVPNDIHQSKRQNPFGRPYEYVSQSQ